MKYFFLIYFILSSLCSFSQNQQQSDSLKITHLLKESENESDTSIQLQKLERVLMLSRDLKCNYGIYTSHKRIARLKKIMYNSDSAVVQYKRGIQDLPNSNIYNYNLYELIGNEFKEAAQYDSSLCYFNKSIKLGEKLLKNSLIAKGYLNIGSMWLQNSQYDKAFKNYAIADSICELDSELETSILRATINNYLGYSVRVTHGYEKAIEYYNKSKHLHEKLKNEAGVQEINIAIAQAKISLGNYDEALKLLNESIKYHEKNAPTLNSYSYGVIVRGFLLAKMNRMKEAEKDYKLYYDLALKSKNKTYQRWGLSYLGDFYQSINRYNTSIEYFKKALKEFKEVKDFSRELKTTKSLIELYKLNNDLKSAIDAYEEYINIQQKIEKKKITEKTYDLETIYQTHKKQQEIALLKTQKELAEHQKKTQRNFLLGGLVLMTLVGLLLFVMYRDRQKTNTKLKELDALKSNFFANISHEFRTPLALISGPVQNVLEDTSLSKERRSQFEMIQKNSNRLLSLVNQLLDLSKIDSGNLNLHIQEGNVLQLISALSNSFSYSAEQKEIDYQKTIETGKIETWFDSDVVEKIVVNLLSNAIKYTPNKGSVVCRASVRDGELHLEVKNTGAVLSPEELNSIFQRFYQTSEQNQGSGIGLALVKELTALHKGSITARSGLGQWTIFNVVLPINRRIFNDDLIISKSEDKVKVEIPNGSNFDYEIDEELSNKEQPILLIVEDNADVTTLIIKNFETSYSVLTAPNGKVGVDLALEHVPDLIISDIMMPVKDGIALTKELKNNECTAHIPIILLTAKADAESEFEGIDIGADDYITKPFDKKLLSLKVKKLIESRKKLQLRYSQELILKPKDIAITNLDEKFLNKVQYVLDNNIAETSFSIDDFSKAVSMSRMQLHRKLKALTGLSASEFILSQRLKLATQLLKESDINISQVGYSVGFNDPAYFSKCFKKIYHCTPSEYAKNQK